MYKSREDDIMTEQEIEIALKFFEENYASFGITKRASGEGMTKNGKKFNLADAFEEALKREASSVAVAETLFSNEHEKTNWNIAFRGKDVKEIKSVPYEPGNIQAA